MNRRNILLIILLVGAALFTFYYFYNQSKTTPVSTPTPTPARNASQSDAGEPQADESEIKTVLEKQVPNISGVKKFEVVELNIKDSFAKATIKPLDVETDNAFVLLQKKDNNWVIIYGPGTDLSPESPIYELLPQGLLGF